MSVITHLMLSVCVLWRAYSSHELHHYLDLSTENPSIEEYIAGDEEEVGISPVFDPNHHNLYFDENNELREYIEPYRYKPLRVKHIDYNGIPIKYTHYRDYPKFVRNNKQHMKSKYHSNYLPSNNIYNYSPKHAYNHNHNRQPIFANLYWRKIIYPNSWSAKAHIPLAEDYSGVRRRHTKDRNKYARRKWSSNASLKPVKQNNPMNRLTVFQPIAASSVLNYNRMSSVKPKPTYSRSSASYNRKPINQSILTKQTNNLVNKTSSKSFS